MEFFASLEKVVESKLGLVLSTYMTVFANKMILLLGAGIPILVIYYGYSLVAGRGSNATISEMLWNIARIGIIFEFMKNTGNLLDLSIGFVQELKSGFVGSKSIFALLDQQIELTKNMAEDLYNLDANVFPFRGFLAALMLWMGSIFTVVTSVIIFISAELALTLLIATAPIFIGCLTYGFLKEMFNGWLRSIFSCIITLTFASMIAKIGLDLGAEFIKHASQSPTNSVLMETGALNLSIGIIVSFLIMKSSSLAGNIAGVAATSVIQGGVAAAAYAGTKLGANAAGRSMSYVAQGGKNFKENTKSAFADRAKLKEGNQQAALERTKQENLAS